jgi:tetratricopeptide (TPR) repeat protein
MRKLLLITTAAFMVALFIAAFKYKYQQQTIVKFAKEENTSFAIGCATGNFVFDEAAEMPALDGWGSVNINIGSKSDSAQYFFNQGMGMFYGFHIIEALGSFKKGQQFDPKNAMLYWAEALSYGPNINDMGYAENPAALAAVAKANEYAASASPIHKMFIEAQSKRYDVDTSIKRSILNQRYADAMKEVYKKFPNNAESAVLYADALMQLHPWDWYNRDKQPKPWTNELVTILEITLKKFPQHTGANHYYIHATEGSTNPARALESAWRLVKSTPGLAHMVHMPSHIFNQTGFYKEGAEQNVKAIAAFKNYSSKYAPVQNAFLLYEVHNRFMEFANRLMIPDAEASYLAAEQSSNSLDTMFNNFPAPIGLFAQHVSSAPLLNHVRYSEWDKILQYPAITDRWIYAHYLMQFARGMALAHKGEYAAALQSLNYMENYISHPDMLIPGPYFNEAAAGGKVALHILKGTIAGQQKKWDEAISQLQEGVQAEESMIYNEPKDWLIPARHFLGNYLLQAKRFAEAEKIFKKDLSINPANSWSLKGLHSSLVAQKKNREAAAIQQLYERKFHK